MVVVLGDSGDDLVDLREHGRQRSGVGVAMGKKRTSAPSSSKAPSVYMTTEMHTNS